jgi:hypothetical protein
MDITAAQWLDAGSKVLGAALQKQPNQSRADASSYAPFETGPFNVTTGGLGLQSALGGSATGSLVVILFVAGVALILWKRSR